MCVLDEEDCKKLPYSIICETRYGSRWNTLKRKRLWMSEFTEQERQRAGNIFRLAYAMELVKGVPDKLTMSKDTLVLWRKLGDFCAEI